MSLQHAAKHLEKHGRNGDTMLVHMSKGEVKSLNDIAMAGGGHLTVNPHTGLPEASFLKRMLPMVIGAGLAATGVGAPMAALMVGGGYTAATGSLKKGLMAGLGAYGGAGLSSSLMQAGAPSVATEAAATAAPAAVPPAPSPVAVPQAPVVDITPIPVSQTPGATAAVSPANPAPGVLTTPASPEVAGLPSMPSNPAYDLRGTAPGIKAPLDTSMPNNAYSLSNQAGNYNMANPVQSPASIATATPAPISPSNMTTAQRFEALKKGATFDNLVDYAKQNPLQAASMAVTAFTPDEKAREKKPVDSDPGQQFDYQANATTPTPMADPYGREQKYYNQRYVAQAANGGMMASGGISDAGYNLGGYSDGGRLLRGPGDGVSDSIPAVIGKKQPARLADGEFVIPARIVSELGNGSTEAGARKLYAMMDRIQKARGKTVGKDKVAKNSRSEKYLPA
jgi:hypothetical protein